MLVKIQEKIDEIIEPLFIELPFELVDYKIGMRSKTAVIEILVDKEGGINIDECASINRRITQKLEEQEDIGEDWVVEVSSPGLDRVLKSQKDFKRVIGQDVRVHLTEKVEGKIEHNGNIMDVTEDNILLTVKGDTVGIPLSKIKLGKQII